MIHSDITVRSLCPDCCVNVVRRNENEMQRGKKCD